MIKVGNVAYTKLNSRGKVVSRDYNYNDVEFDEDGWADVTKFMPADFDLVSLKIEGRVEPISGWSTGINWDGLFYKPGDKVLHWKRETDERNLM